MQTMVQMHASHVPQGAALLQCAKSAAKHHSRLNSAMAFLCRHQVAAKDVPSPYEGAFPENIKS